MYILYVLKLSVTTIRKKIPSKEEEINFRDHLNVGHDYETELCT